jgi:hypothetical protein
MLTLLQPFNLDTTKDYTFANATLGNLATANYYTGNGSLLSGVLATSATTAATVTTAAQPNITSVGTLSSLTVTGNVSANYFIGNGSQLTGLPASYSNTNVAAYLPTYTGNVSANYFIGNGSTLTNVTGANVSGYVPLSTTANTAATVTTAAQPNITSVGTLSSLSVSGLITATGTGIKTANIQDSTGTITITTRYGNIAGDVGVYGNLTVGTSGTGNVIASYFIGDGSQLTSISNANTATSANTAATVTTNAQPNITSVGTLSSLIVTGNITGGNANLGNLVIANYFIGDGSQLTGLPASYSNTNVAAYLPTYTGNVSANYFIGNGSQLTGVTTSTAATVTTNAQPNITSIGNLTGLVVSNSTGIVDFTTSANVTLGNISNLHITGGSANYVIITDGSGNLSWAAQSGGGASVAGSNTQVQFNDSSSFGASANFTFNKTSNTLTVDKAIHLNGANLGSNVSNLYIGGGGVSQILATDGSGNLTWIAQPTAVITVDNFTGNGVQTVFSLSTTPANINQTMVNIDGVFQLRSGYSLTGPNITFSEAPANGYSIEVTTTMGATSGAGAFITRAYTGTGSQANFTVTSGSTVSSVIVTENGIVQAPTTDYTISDTTLTFTTAPASNVAIQVRELAIAIATTTSPVYRAYTGNGVANTFTITSGLSANSLIVAENGIIQRPTTDYSVSGSNVVFVSAPASNVDIQIRELSLNGGGTSSGISLPTQSGNGGKYLTTDGATASWANVGGSLTIKEEGSNLTTAVASIDFVGGGVTATNTGNAVTVTVPTGTTRAQAMTMGIIFGG